MYPKRSRAATIARDTLDIIAAGRYQNRRGETVPIAHLVEAARDGTRTYPPDEPLPRFDPSGAAGVFETVNDTTLAASHQLVREGFRPVALNFASARHPGGGFLGGARAQEESLCRASALYACINGNPMYRDHAHTGGGFYTNYAIYSPAVPVFKDDEGELLDNPYLCAFVTSPAVNVGAIRDSERRLVRDEMRERIDKVLTLMAGHGHDAVVLGAWGCGVFKNEPDAIAELFAKALRGRFAGCFAKVVFAVLDSSAEERFIGPFAKRFGSHAPPPV
ncbi:TIGR02452 family protein [Gemmata sp. JC717]|uniref:TIGR02452 family protein n=1 Tax=Gemmata algarum TaxID=2975278 RepID=UPI0021BA40CA|nr:TIGR02452 family protein [Gemmata algarum]MDY3555671.1 TIGR02452 family protein [Gemmata algarum]